jgi:hypothetical protein
MSDPIGTGELNKKKSASRLVVMIKENYLINLRKTIPRKKP